MRYAGYHLKNFIKNPSNRDELRRAESHCKRAIYDAYEASIIFYLETFKQFKEDYSNVTISDVLPQYLDYKLLFEEVIDFIETIDKESKDEVYERCHNYNKNLREVIKKIENAREELNKNVKKERNKILSAILGTIISTTGLIFVILQFMNCK